MVRIELEDADVRRLRVTLEIARSELMREIARTDDRAFRHELVDREEFLAQLLDRLPLPHSDAA